jgi:hypothetical protein
MSKSVDKFCKSNPGSVNLGNIGVNINPDSEAGKEIQAIAEKQNCTMEQATQIWLKENFCK